MRKGGKKLLSKIRTGGTITYRKTVNKLYHKLHMCAMPNKNIRLLVERRRMKLWEKEDV
jgi:hypothetical protein